jgi:hypothetical protein
MRKETRNFINGKSYFPQNQVSAFHCVNQFVFDFVLHINQWKIYKVDDSCVYISKKLEVKIN